MGSKKKVLAVDMDGTLIQYDYWRGVEHYGDPIPGMREVLQEVRDAGWCIVIWTVRSDNNATRNHLIKHNIPFDYINESPYSPSDVGPKIPADVYLDDRAINFSGSVEGLINRILNFEKWYKIKDN